MCPLQKKCSNLSPVRLALTIFFAKCPAVLQFVFAHLSDVSVNLLVVSGNFLVAVQTVVVIVVPQRLAFLSILLIVPYLA